MAAYATSAFQASVMSSPLWKRFKQFTLIINQRARRDPEYHRTTLAVGNGEMGEIKVTDLDPRIRTFTTVSDSLQWLYETDVTHPYADVDTINSCVVQSLSTNGKVIVTCRSIDAYVSQPGLEVHELLSRLPQEEAAVFHAEKLLRDAEILHAEREHVHNSRKLDDFDDIGVSCQAACWRLVKRFSGMLHCRFFDRMYSRLEVHIQGSVVYGVINIYNVFFFIIEIYECDRC